jgi:hypothetical protein
MSEVALLVAVAGGTALATGLGAVPVALMGAARTARAARRTGGRHRLVVALVPSAHGLPEDSAIEPFTPLLPVSSGFLAGAMLVPARVAGV